MAPEIEVTRDTRDNGYQFERIGSWLSSKKSRLIMQIADSEQHSLTNVYEVDGEPFILTQQFPTRPGYHFIDKKVFFGEKIAEELKSAGIIQKESKAVEAGNSAEWVETQELK